MCTNTSIILSAARGLGAVQKTLTTDTLKTVTDVINPIQFQVGTKQYFFDIFCAENVSAMFNR